MPLTLIPIDTPKRYRGGRKAKVLEPGFVKSFLRVIELAGKASDNGELCYKVYCSNCQAEKVIRGQLLRANQKITSCGCYIAEKIEQWRSNKTGYLPSSIAEHHRKEDKNV
jgi:hypothetical protein